MNKEIKAILDKVLQEGWILVRTKRHTKIYNPDGKLCAVAALSPSDPRSIKNLKSHIKKARKEYVGCCD